MLGRGGASSGAVRTRPRARNVCCSPTPFVRSYRKTLARAWGGGGSLCLINCSSWTTAVDDDNNYNKRQSTDMVSTHDVHEWEPLCRK